MAKIVMKFGGTSVADLDRIRHVANLVAGEVKAGNQVAVVVSAMAGETNKLVGWVKALDPLYDAAEYDTVVASGEQVTCGLLAIALGAIGIKARSFLGWQMPLQGAGIHASARIDALPPENLNACLESGTVAACAGFQGVMEDGRIATLGRGGSDTSAVAIAAAIKADRCDIYTDVDGVYTTDPRIVSRAQRMEKIAFEEMLEMASLGAKVLQTRSVEIAMKYRVPVRVLSSFNPKAGGTLLCDEEDIMENKPVTGIAYSRDEAKITLLKIPDHPGIAAAIFGPLADAGINVDMIVQNISDDGKKTDLTFTCNRGEVAKAMNVLEKAGPAIGYREITSDDGLAKVSVIGIGMRTHPGVAQEMFRTLSEKGINIHVITTSEIKISILISEEYVELAVRALHSAYGLDAIPA